MWRGGAFSSNSHTDADRAGGSPGPNTDFSPRMTLSPKKTSSTRGARGDFSSRAHSQLELACGGSPVT